MLAALGYSLVDTEFAGKGVIVPELTSVSFMPLDGRSELKFLNKGSPAKVDEMKAKEIMEQEDVEVVVDLRNSGEGTGQDVGKAVFLTCDLTHEFVTTNGG